MVDVRDSVRVRVTWGREGVVRVRGRFEGQLNPDLILRLKIHEEKKIGLKKIEELFFFKLPY